MIVEKTKAVSEVELNGKIIKCYNDFGENLDPVTVQSFGEEWENFHNFSDAELERMGDGYFDIVPEIALGSHVKAIDLGCGSGRWSKYLHRKVGEIAAIDPSHAIFSASYLLKDSQNVKLYQASIDNLPFSDNYFDFGFSLGVLHHIPDTEKAMTDCVRIVKPGGYFLVYLYYSLDNRGLFFKVLFRFSNFIRKGICKLPSRAKRFFCDVLAVFFYMPFIYLSRILKLIGVNKRIRNKIPLNVYESSSFYVIRNDSLDRFGTPLEQRFSKKEIENMMQKAGLTEIVFSDNLPFWHAIGKKI